MSNPLTYTYTSGVPQGNQQINNTQTPILNNFQDISQLIDINHVGFNTVDTFGNHTVVDYFQQPTDPITDVDQIALYSKASTSGNISELFYRYPNNGTVVQLTGSASNSSASSTSSTTSGSTGSGGGQTNASNPNSGGVVGYQYLSNGLLMMWGLTPSYFPTTSSGTATFTFPVVAGFPSFSATPFHMEFNMNYPGSLTSVSVPHGQIYITPVSATQFSIHYVGLPYPNTPGKYFNWSANWMAIGI